MSTDQFPFWKPTLQTGLFGTSHTVSREKPQASTEGEETEKSQEANKGQSVTGGADSWYTNHNPDTIRLSIYNRELQFRHYRVPRVKKTYLRHHVTEHDPDHARADARNFTPPTRQAGDIVQFSKKSRMRMLRMFNRIQHILLGKPIFITLTAHPDCFKIVNVQEQFQKTFIPVLRLAVPRCEYVWKMEPHRDGRAHYHLLVWSRHRARKLNSEFYKRKIRQLWRNCIEDHSRASELYSAKIKKVENEKAAFHYLSKYMFKEEGHETAHLTGRRWGKSATLPIDPIIEKALSRGQYEKMKSAALELIRQKKRNYENQHDWIEAGNDWYIWLDDEEMIEVLKAGNCFDLWGMLNRWRKTGTVGWQGQELASIAAEFGHDY